MLTEREGGIMNMDIKIGATDMKYLKKFNEELKPLTYRNAARKLKKMGHSDRASELEDWSVKKEGDINYIKWQKSIEEYAKFGTFKLNIELDHPTKKGNIKDDFYLDIVFDVDCFIDSLYDREGNGNRTGSISFFVGIIPTTEELKKKCDEMLPEPDMGNGFYWGMSIGLDFEIVNDEVNFTKFYIGNYDERISGDVSLADRSSAGKLRNLLKKMFTDPSLNYPSGRTDVEYRYQSFEQSILSEAGFSSDYGFRLEDAAEFLNTISPNTMYKTI